MNLLEFAAMETVRLMLLRSDEGVVIALITLILIFVALRAIIFEVPWIMLLLFSPSSSIKMAGSHTVTLAS